MLGVYLFAGSELLLAGEQKVVILRVLSVNMTAK